MARTDPLHRDLPDTIQALAEAVIAGRATEDQRQQLEQLVVNNPQASQLYVQYMQESVAIHRRARELKFPSLDGQCCGHDRSCAQFASPPNGQQPCNVSSPPTLEADEGPRRTQRLVHALPVLPTKGSVRDLRSVISVTLAALLLGLCGFWIWTTVSPTPPTSAERIAKITHSTDAVWSRNGEPLPLRTGDWLMADRYFLREGFAQMVFPWGTEVTLEAPTEIEFSPDGYKSLLSGQLVAKVSPDDFGFSIETPTVKVIDLGTEFGLSADQSGESEVHVFKGAVEARQKLLGDQGLASPIKLSAGEATGFGVMDSPVRRIVFNPRRFSNAWRVTSRVSETRGDLQFVHPPPRSVVEGGVESSDRLILFLEAEGTILPEALAVTTTQPGLCTTIRDRAAWLPADLLVDSYLVHFDPVGSKPYQAVATRQGAVTFDRPIVGIIARGDQLTASDNLFATPGTEYVAPASLSLFQRENSVGFLTNAPTYTARGLSGLWQLWGREPPPPNDWFRVSPDRRTLTIQCSAGGEADQLRVLVAATSEEPLLPEVSHARLSQPYHGRPYRTGEIVQAEDFDLGGNGVGYYDLTPDALANVYRLGDSVELATYVRGDREETTVCMTHAGEWLAYTFHIDQPGEYVIQARVASAAAGGEFRFEMGERLSTPSLVVPRIDIYSSGAYPPDLFEILESAPVWLDAGRQTLRVVMEKNNHAKHRIADFDWFCVKPAGENRGLTRTGQHRQSRREGRD